MPIIRHPCWGGPCWNIAIILGIEKLEWCGYPTVKKFSKHIYFLYRIHERDRRTKRQRDKWTDAHHTTAQTATLMHYINNFVQWNYKTNSSFEVTTHNYHIKKDFINM